MNAVTTQATVDWRDLTRREYEGKWLPPMATPDNRAIASQALALIETKFEPANPDGVRRWLQMLGTMTAGKTSAAEAHTKVELFAGMLDFPAGCYSKATLKAAAEKFSWFPSYAELHAFLTEENRRMFKDKFRLEQIAHFKPKIPEPEIDRSPEAVARWNAALASLGASWKV